jgi:hypothetical protein
MVFEMVGQFNGRVIFPMAQQPDFFPNASDVTLALDDQGISWFLFVAQGSNAEFYVSDAINVSSCK